MKMVKKIAMMLVAFTFVFALAACGSGEKKPESSEAPKASEQASEQKSGEASSQNTEAKFDGKLYLITDQGTIDDKSFNQGSFEGLKKYGAEIGVDAQYLRPAGEGDQNYMQAINQAIQDGAKVIVTPGFLFENAVGAVQKEHPEVKFIAVDFVPKDANKQEVIAENTVSINYREEQAGFLAGYAAVKDGHKNLGFMGGVAVPAVIHYGFGFAAGANAAAKEMGIKVNLKYNYTGSFVAKPEIQTMAASWYKQGTEVIFSCGGGIAASVLKAAQENNGVMIGVDVDQKDQGEQIVTSAMKNLSLSVYEAAKKAVEGGFEGGKKIVLGVKENGVQISDDFSRFKTFKQEDYKAIFQQLVENKDGITDSIPVIDTTLKQEEQADPTKFADKLPEITIDFIK